MALCVNNVHIQDYTAFDGFKWLKKDFSFLNDYDYFLSIAFKMSIHNP